jgi:hypothetical protein
MAQMENHAVGEAGLRTVAHGFTRGKDARFGFRSAL